MVMRYDNIKGLWKFTNVLLLLAIILHDVGTFDVLPLNLSQFIVIGLGFIQIIESSFGHKKLRYKLNIFFLITYVTLITFTQEFDFDSVKSVIYFSIALLVLYNYANEHVDDEVIIEILYTASFILAFIGCIQEIGYILGIEQLYDFTRYGLAGNGVSMFQNSFRLTSIYTEPAHLSSIFAGGIYIGMLSRQKKFKFVKIYKTGIILVATILSLSSVVYVSVAFVIASYILFCERGMLKKTKRVIGILCGVVILLILYPEQADQLLDKLGTMKTADASLGMDLSAFAIISNIKIAMSKMFDGYILGTGYDSHRLYYYAYADALFGNVLMYANIDEAASLYTRIFSEFGIVGISAYIVWLISKYLGAFKYKNYKDQCLVLILLVQGLRNGHYAHIITLICFASLLRTSTKYFLTVKNEGLEKR